MRPDFKKYQGSGLLMLTHSAKGTTWDEHKYIKRIDGTYYYPDDYEGGRHLPSNSNSETDDTETNLSDNDVEKLALEVIRGNFGNGQERKDLLGEYYQQVQNRVNEILKSSTGSTKVSDIKKEDVEKGKEVSENVVKKEADASPKKSIDYETVYRVYRKR